MTNDIDSLEPVLEDRETQERRPSGLRTLGSFASTTVLSGVVSVLSIPLIVLFADTASWGAVALGQAVGSSVGVLAMFGWGITGPARVAMMPPTSRAAAYWDSIVARAYLFAPALVITGVVTWVLVPTAQVASTTCAIAMAFGGLSGSWFLVGVKRPDRLFWLDTVPRVGGTVLGIVALAVTDSLVLFAVLQLLGSFAAFGLVTRWIVPALRRPEGAVRGFRRTLVVLAEQRHGVGVAVAVASYYPIVLAIVAGFAPAFLPLYALNEKLLRFATMALQPALQFFQASVPVQRGAALGRAVHRSLGAVVVLGLLSWAAFALLMPVASTILTGGEVKVPLVAAINLGAYMGGIVVMNYMVSVALIAVDRVALVSRGSIIGSAIGLALVLVLAVAGDGVYLSWGLVATAVLIVGFQSVVLARALPARVRETSDREPVVGAA